MFSGRRGIHCWVSDYEARTLDGPGRSAVADYLCLITGGDNQSKKVHLLGDNLHTSIRRAITIVDKHFEDILSDQQFFSAADGLKKLLTLIPDETLKLQVERGLHKMVEDSVERWRAFENIYMSYCKENGSLMRKIKHLLEEIKLQYCYPRLDINVTKGFNHLLKSPFSIHPKTGKVCVVFKSNEAKNMKLDEVPAIYSLLDDGLPESAQHQANMRTAVKNFQEVVFALEKTEAFRRKQAGSKYRIQSKLGVALPFINI